MIRWQHFLWLGAVAVLLGGSTTPTLAQNRQVGARSSNQQSGGTCQQGNTSSTGVNAATTSRASGTQNSSGTQTLNQQMLQKQIAMMKQYITQLMALQQTNQAQLAMLQQYLAQLTALEQQISQAGTSQTSTGQNVTQSTNAAATRRTAAR